MFRFHFDLEDGPDEATFVETVPPADGGQHAASIPQKTGVPFSEIDLDALLEALPTQISYSFVSAPAPDGHTPDLTLARRDLFDARFQLISEGTGDPGPTDQTSASDPSFASALQFVDNPSDLVPLVYEGGLKTWECSLDLASCLRRDGHAANVNGRRVLELGCGTAIPILSVLQEIFSSSPASDTETHIHLQDYNASVLQLVTLPNVVLAWYTSPAADTYRNSETLAPEDVDSEMHISPQLLDAFKASLRDYRLGLRFFTGSWDTFDLHHAGGSYDLVLTSETVYHPNSLPSLVRIMMDAYSVGHEYCCLVAAKTVYFGVGGGIAEFVRCVESMASERGYCAQVETIWEKSTGVSRRVMRVRWT